MRSAVRFVFFSAALLIFPSLAFAQATITGTVRDTSGGVLPGVTVEAISPALAGTSRPAVSDAAGIYRIIDLPPGTYTVTATLPGFNTVKQEGIVVGGTATLTIPVEMRVGGLEETITVTSESPVVDLQNVKRETVLSAETIETVPGTRTVGNLLNATPGLTVDNNGLNPTPTMTFFSARGGQTNEGRMSINGLTVAAAFNGGGVSSFILDTANVDEVSVTVSGGLGESDTGGPVMNLVPRSGGNDFRGTLFYNNAGDWSRSSNIDDELRAVGIADPPGIIKSYDWSATYGGPIVRDRLWFLGSYRSLRTDTNVEGIVANANAGDLTRWDWARDASLPARQAQGRKMYIGRATAQLGKNRINFSHEFQTRCEGAPLRADTDEGCQQRGSNWIASAGATTSPEAATAYIDFPYYLTQALWTAPVTNKILLEAGYSRLSYEHAGGPGQLAPDGFFDIGVTEQSAVANPAIGYVNPVPRANYQYRALSQYADNWSNPNHWRASASYVTGSHSVKVGYQGSLLINETTRIRHPGLVSYTFNQGIPTAVSYAIPDWQTADTTKVAALFVQDTWTRNRLTLSGALRYDRASSFSPAEGNGTSTTSAVNAQPISFGRSASVDAFNDITPRIGVAYDVFGNGKTALKFNWGHYLDAATNDSAYTRNNPAASRFISTVPATAGQPGRGWTDSDNDKVVDCNLLVPTANGECAALTGNNLNFGNTNPNVERVNEETLRGWGVRENDWQWGITVQQELMPRMSIEVGYARRWFHGFTVTDDTNRTPDEYDSYVITAPADSRLPNGGGYPIRIFVPTAAAAAVAPANYVTFESDFGPERTNYWHGADVTFNARLRGGLNLQLGTSTGRSIEDRCEVVVNIDSPDPRNCLDVDPFQTTVRGLATYTIPKIDVLVSGTFRSQPPQELVAGANPSATWNVPNSVVQQLLGRLPVGSTPTGTTAINLLDTDHRMFVGGRRNQIDMRLAKILRFGSRRADIGVDLNNLLNTNYATAYTQTYQYSANNTGNGGTFLNPTGVINPRFVRLAFTFSF